MKYIVLTQLLTGGLPDAPTRINAAMIVAYRRMQEETPSTLIEVAGPRSTCFVRETPEEIDRMLTGVVRDSFAEVVVELARASGEQLDGLINPDRVLRYAEDAGIKLIHSGSRWEGWYVDGEGRKVVFS